MHSAIKVRNLSKRYRLGLTHTNSIRDGLNALASRLFHQLRRKDRNPGPQDKTRPDAKGYFNALDDVSFEVQPGEVLGIIGRNGAGKSTLLKILSRITSPTSGRVEMYGRVASLLEVGTGFHPELTGRENVFLNGTILGMSRSEVHRQFEAIVDFAGVEKFIDTPVKRYSSGMKVRLGFAVAAHLQPEILIVDEVLAVGDFEFQRKCLSKMNDVARTGRTVIFVSHNMSAVRTLCTTGLLLSDGHIESIGSIDTVIGSFLGNAETTKEPGSRRYADPTSATPANITETSIRNGAGLVRTQFYNSEAIHIVLKLKVHRTVRGLKAGISIRKLDGTVLCQSFSNDAEDCLAGVAPGDSVELTIGIPGNLLNSGCYEVRPSVGIHRQEWFQEDLPGPQFEIYFDVPNKDITVAKRLGEFAPMFAWQQQCSQASDGSSSPQTETIHGE